MASRKSVSSDQQTDPSAKGSGKTYDDVFNHVKSFGRYQWFLYVGSKLIILPIAGQFSILIWGQGTPKFQCITPNVTCAPRMCCVNCTSYAFSGDFQSSVSEWNLICDRGHIGALLQMAYFCGMLLGSMVTGMMSDAFGRKPTMFGCFLIMFAAALGSAYADCISLFALLRFVVGFCTIGANISNYVFAMELVGPKRRTTAATFTGIFWLVSGGITLLEAYFIRDWRLLLTVYTLPAVLLLPFLGCIPESPRWLVVNGRIDDAMTVLLKCGAKQGTPIDTGALRNLLEEIRAEQLKREEKQKTFTVIDLVRTKKLRRRSIILCYKWFAVAFVGFGMYLYVSQLAGNIYVNYAIMEALGAILIPTDWVLLSKFGRRLVSAGYCFIGGTALLIAQAIYVDYPLVTTGICLFALMFGPSWNAVYLLTTELFPTELRSTAIGTGSVAARIGGIIAPYAPLLAQLPGMSMSVPVTIFGVVGLVAGVLMFFLPETLLAEMHQTIDDAESAKEYYGLVCCGKPLKRKRDNIDAQEKDKDVDAVDGVVLTNFGVKSEYQNGM